LLFLKCKNTHNYEKDFFLLAAILMIYGCGGSGNSTATNSATQKRVAYERYAFIADSPSTGSTVVSKPIISQADFSVDLVNYTLADTMVKKYFWSNHKNPANNFHFCFHAEHLRGYIDSVQSPIIQFFLAKDTSKAGTQLYMMASPIDSSGLNAYYQFNGNSFVLSSCDTYQHGLNVPKPGDIGDTIALNLPNTAMLKSYFVGAMPSSTAHDSAKAYLQTINSTGRPILANSWLYSANDLLEMIKEGEKLSDPLKFVAVYLAFNNNHVDIMICGLTGSGKQIQFNYNKKQCVLENANPCPTCYVSTTGTILSATH